MQNEQKIVFVSHYPITKEVKALKELFHLPESLGEEKNSLLQILQRFQVVVVDLSENNLKSWFASGLPEARTNLGDRLKVVYLARKDRTCVPSEIKESYPFVNAVMKYLPEADTALQFIGRLVDHIPTGKKSVFEHIKDFFKKKLLCK